jgi:hypothetical protein
MDSPGMIGGRSRHARLANTVTAGKPETTIRVTLASLKAPGRIETTGHRRARDQSDFANHRYHPTGVLRMLDHVNPVPVKLVATAATLNDRPTGTDRSEQSHHRVGTIMAHQRNGIAVLRETEVRVDLTVDPPEKPRFPLRPQALRRMAPRSLPSTQSVLGYLGLNSPY